MTRVLRGIALLVAAAAVVDPAVRVSRLKPAAVELRGDGSADADAVRSRLLADLAGGVAQAGTGSPAAVVLLGGCDGSGPRADGCMQTALEGVPVSAVTFHDASAADVRLLRVSTPPRVLQGQVGVVTAEVEATAAAGQTTRIVLQESGADLETVEHRWSRNSERFTASFGYVAVTAGLHDLRVVAGAVPGERQLDDNTIRAILTSPERTLRVLTIEPRPAWAVAFLRRMLEVDPAFEISAVARPAHGLLVRGGAPPVSLSRHALEPFDAVLVGAPELLSRADLDALRWFMHERGGAVLWLPDQRPSGEYATAIAPAAFDQVLLARPLPLRAAGHDAGLVSELALPATWPRGCEALATVDNGSGDRPAIVSCAAGVGRSVFSGALDAWRFRSAEGYARFWSATLAGLAAGAPHALNVEVSPVSARAGTSVRLSVSVRRTEWQHGKTDVAVPPVSARLVAAAGTATPVRVWPGTELGRYEGWVTVAAAGEYHVEVEGGGATAAVPLVVESISHPTTDESDTHWIVRATGGVEVGAADLGPLEALLRGLPRDRARVAEHPMRSAWWAGLFAAVLSAEWWWRRRAGAR